MRTSGVSIDSSATRAQILTRAGVGETRSWRDNDVHAYRGTRSGDTGDTGDKGPHVAPAEYGPGSTEPASTPAVFIDLDAQPLLPVPRDDSSSPAASPDRSLRDMRPPDTTGDTNASRADKAGATSQPPAETSPAATIEGDDDAPLTPAVMRRIVHWATTRAGQQPAFARTQANIGDRGLCFGIVRFCQSDGSLGRYLELCHAVDPAQFAVVFGPGEGLPNASSNELLETTTADTREARIAPVGGSDLWHSTWVTRFKRAAQHKPFRNMQFRAAAELVLVPSLSVAKAYALNTERALALLLERVLSAGQESTEHLLDQLPQGSLGQRLQALAELASNASSTNHAAEILNATALADAPLNLDDARLE